MPAVRVPFLDLRVTDDDERRDIIDAVEDVLRHGRIVLGPEVDELERQVAALCGRRYAVGVSSGTDALFLALKALRIGAGDEVITTPLSFVATANAIALNGATPVFVDIADDLNLDPSSIEGALSPRTRAIIPVHFTGKLCRMDEILAIARAHDLLVIEDASQAFGASYEGRMAGSFGDVGCFSMNPMKVFAACGEAGIIVTDREGVRDHLVALRYNGMVQREVCQTISTNGRIDTLQAAILLRRLPRVEGTIARRREIASWYGEALSHLAAVIDLPAEAPGYRDVFYTYTIRTQRRDELKQFLESSGIETRIQHLLLMPQQPVYAHTSRASFPNAARLVNHVLCLPNSQKLTLDLQQYVVKNIRGFFAHSRDS